MEEIRKYSLSQFKEFLHKELSSISDMQLLILKGHILVEYTLNCFLEAISKSDDPNFFKENFSFAHKIQIVKHFGPLLHGNAVLVKELTLLNRLRNNIAHSLSYDEKHLVELFAELNKKDPDSIYVDKQKSSIVKLKSAILFLSGVLFGGFMYYRDSQALDEFIDGTQNIQIK